MMKTIKPLNKRGIEINYVYTEDTLEVQWGKTNFKIRKTIIDEILNDYLVDKNEWYPVGANIEEPLSGGLGAYVNARYQYSPKYAGALAAIMHAEKLVRIQGKRPIELQKI